MDAVFLIAEDDGGLWRIVFNGGVVAQQLSLAEAIKKAGRLAHQHHKATGDATTVDLVLPDGSFTLVYYGPGGEMRALHATKAVAVTWPPRPRCSLAMRNLLAATVEALPPDSSPVG